jgi:hypothetical protein
MLFYVMLRYMRLSPDISLRIRAKRMGNHRLGVDIKEDVFTHEYDMATAGAWTTFSTAPI